VAARIAANARSSTAHSTTAVQVMKPIRNAAATAPPPPHVPPAASSASSVNGGLDEAAALAAAMAQSLQFAPSQPKPSQHPAAAAAATPSPSPAGASTATSDSVSSSFAAVAGRFTEFVHLEVDLSPIRGVFNDTHNPEVSIADALARVPIDLADYLFAANRWARRSGKPMIEGPDAVPDMTADRAMAIWLYTCNSPLYAMLNVALRSADRSKLTTEYFPYLRLLLTGMALVRKKEGTDKRMVNRGVPKLDLVTLYPDEYVKGETLLWWSFSSTTADIGVLQNSMFLGTSGPRTIFQIHTSASVDVSAFSPFREAERLLPPGTALRITGILPKIADGLTIITCEDDPDAPSLVA
jgi:hypothetical protein